MASKTVPLILGSALALSVSGMALAQTSNAQNNKPIHRKETPEPSGPSSR
jgi:hypothetical protein